MSEKPAKKSRAQLAREQAAKIRQQQAKREKMHRNIIYGSFGAILLLVGAIAFFLLRGSSGATPDSHLNSDNTTTAVQEWVKDRPGTVFGTGLKAGAVNEGKPTIDLYWDYTCSHCQTFDHALLPVLREQANAGAITLIMHPLPLLGHNQPEQFSTQSATAAYAVLDLAPDKIAPFSEAMYKIWNNALYDAEGKIKPDSEIAKSLPKQSDIAAAALAAGVPADVTAKFTDAKYSQLATKSYKQFTADGHTGTPTVLLNHAKFEGWADKDSLLKSIADAK